jgi:hypothetical protein
MDGLIVDPKRSVRGDVTTLWQRALRVAHRLCSFRNAASRIDFAATVVERR